MLSEITRRSAGGNWALEVYKPYPCIQEASATAHGYTGGFGIDLMPKDLGLAQESATTAKARPPWPAWPAPSTQRTA